MQNLSNSVSRQIGDNEVNTSTRAGTLRSLASQKIRDHVAFQNEYDTRDLIESDEKHNNQLKEMANKIDPEDAVAEAAMAAMIDKEILSALSEK